MTSAISSVNANKNKLRLHVGQLRHDKIVALSVGALKPFKPSYITTFSWNFSSTARVDARHKVKAESVRCSM